VSRRLTLESGEVIAEDVLSAHGPFARARGLLGRARLRSGQALVIEGGNQVHTFGLRYPIDVLFCDGDWAVLHVVRGMAPRRVTRWIGGARRIVELPAGALPEDAVPGVRLVLD
jgi:uncharacterized membrane protein (UPF0127 family)